MAASGSSGTLGAGDYLKERHGTRTVAVEALECPTMLYNGFGEHNIQGIGDKHIPLVHNVMGTDAAVAVSDTATDGLFMAFGHEAGRRILADRGVPGDVLASLHHFGLSSICNVLAAIKYARTAGLGSDDVIITVATDGAALYESERPRLVGTRFGGSFDAGDAMAQIDRHLAGADTSHVALLDDVGRSRVFNLGYFTWVEPARRVTGGLRGAPGGCVLGPAPRHGAGMGRHDRRVQRPQRRSGRRLSVSGTDRAGIDRPGATEPAPGTAGVSG